MKGLWHNDSSECVWYSFPSVMFIRFYQPESSAQFNWVSLCCSLSHTFCRCGQTCRMKYVLALQNSHCSMWAFVGDRAQVPHCSPARLILFHRILVRVQCVRACNIPSFTPCVVFPIAFCLCRVKIEVCLQELRKKTRIFFFSSFKRVWPIFQSFPFWITQFSLHSKRFSVVFPTSEPLFGGEHVNMFAQQFRQWIHNAVYTSAYLS